MANFNWEKVRIGNAGRVITGRTPPTVMTHYFGDEYPFITPSDMNGDKNIINVERGLSQAGANLLSRNLLPPKSVMVSCIGWQMGKAAVTTRPSFTNQQINAIIPNKNVDEDFLYYILCTYQTELKNLGSVGTRTPILNKSSFENVQIVLPPLPTQRKIASILSAYDDLIKNNTRRIAILEEMAQSLYREWFVHFRFPGHEKNTMVESPFGLIPQEWDIKAFGELLKYHIGGGWGKDELDEEYTEPAYVIRGTDIPDARYLSIKRCPLRFHTKSNVTSRYIQSKDIIFEVSGGSKGQPVGRALQVSQQLIDAFDEDIICASFCKVLRINERIIAPEILFWHLQEIYGDGRIEKYQVQSTGIINFKFAFFLESEMVIVPPQKLQERFTETVSSILEEVQVLSARNVNLRRTRDLLLPKLISGELDVEELDIEVGDDVGDASSVEPVTMVEPEEAALRQDRFNWNAGDVVFS